MNSFTQKIIQDKKCCIYDTGGSDILLIQAIGEHDAQSLDNEIQFIKRSSGTEFTFAAFQVTDWNDELSPWEAPAVFGEEIFGSGAAKTLSFITDALLPELYGSNENKRCYLGGYSLSGLFALWAAYQTDIFSGIAAVSPSVWFPGWCDYIGSHEIKSAKVYLSLGDKEEKVRNKILSAVGDSIRFQHESLIRSSAVKNCELVWNHGNHFSEPDLRTAKGFAWLLNCNDS